MHSGAETPLARATHSGLESPSLRDSRATTYGFPSFAASYFTALEVSGALTVLTPGTVINDRFEIIAELGVGGMGVVYKVLDLQLDKVRALKAILPHLVANENLRQRFRNEVDLCQNLSHPRIVRVYDLGQDRETGCDFFTMQYIEGRSLHAYLVDECQGRMGVGEAIRIMDQLCDGLDYAHQTTIHRDLKPHNIMLDAKNEVIILDFGLAKLADPMRTFASSSAVGTPNYQSPEQRLQPESVDTRTDIWSLGVIFYELITGTLPLGTYDPPSVIEPAIPTRVDRIVKKCLRPQPERRYQSATEFRRALERLHGKSRSYKGLAFAALAAAIAAIGLAFTFISSPPSRQAEEYAPEVIEHLDDPKAATIEAGQRWLHNRWGAEAVTTEVVDLGNGVTLDLVWILPGTFTMGSPPDELGRTGDETEHQVEISTGFWMGKYEVTKAQWLHVMGSLTGVGMPEYSGESNSPAVYMNWLQADEFTKKLSDLTGDTYRLPTEAEWEYACRAKQRMAFYYGNYMGQLNRYGWFELNAFSVDEAFAHEVGRLRPNPWGLYDMHGNVAEWCQDWYAPYSAELAVDPTGPTEGLSRVHRGGSFKDRAVYCRSAARDWAGPTDIYQSIGLRVVREAATPSETANAIAPNSRGID